MEKRLYLSNNKIISGVYAGMAEYIGADPTIIRLIAAALTVFTGIFPGVIFYIVCLVIIPQNPSN